MLKKIFLICFLAISFVLIITFTTQVFAFEMPIEASTGDDFFVQAAINFNDAKFCEKINPKALVLAGWGGEGTKRTYVKSHCYWNVAVNTYKTEPCSKVIPVSEAGEDGSHFSQEYCEKEVLYLQRVNGIGNPGRGTDVLDQDVPFFVAAGYTEQKLSGFLNKMKKDEIEENATSADDNRQSTIHDIYLKAVTDPAFVDKVQKLAQQNKPLHSDMLKKASMEEDFEYFVGSETSSSEICELLPDNIYSDSIGYPLYLRNECFTTVAERKGDLTLCDRIVTTKNVAAGFPENWSKDVNSPDSCKYQINKYPGAGVAGTLNNSNHSYDMQVLEYMLPKLGKPLPSLEVKPVDAIKPTDLYSGFYEYIVKSAPQGEREEFKEKMLNLP